MKDLDKILKYCFVVPRLVKGNNRTYMFPIGIAYVSSSFKTTDRTIYTFNLNYKNSSVFSLMKEIILKYDIDVIATGGLTAQYDRIREILVAAKKIKKDIKTIVGGGIITSDPQAGMESLELVDYGIIGEGEITMQELADALEGKKNLKDVNGLIYFDRGNWVITQQRAEIMDLDSLPYPDYDSMEYNSLLDRMSGDIWGLGKERFGYVSMSRSCPFNCTFCFHPSGTKYRKRSLDSIFDEIDYLIEKFHVENLEITDELFVMQEDTLKDFCQRIKGRHIGFSIQLRVDMVNRQMLTELKNAGCLTVGFGLESADNRILDSMKKHINISQIEEALDICYELGLNIIGNFIFGDQAETVETYHNTLKWWREHPKFPIYLHPIVLYPGSELYKIACQRNIIKDKVDFIRNGCPYTNISKMSESEYKKMLLDISMETHGNREKLHAAKVKYLGANKVELSALCPHCSERNQWKGIEVFRNLGNIICEKCNQSIYTMGIDYVQELVKNNFKKLKGRRIAVWPMICSVKEMCNSIPDLMDDNVYFIDSSTMKIGSVYNKKMIYHPNIIREKDIEIVLITISTEGLLMEILEMIKVKYPAVKYVFFAGDLADKDFDMRESMLL